MSTVSVIICTKDRFTNLESTLCSLEKQSRRPEELIIVDASTTDAPPQLYQLIHKFDSHKYIQTLPGLTSQRNRGIDESTGDLVLFFDDDVILDNDYIAQLVQVFESDKTGYFGGGMGQIIKKTRRAHIFHKILGKIFFLGETKGKGRLKLSGFVSFPHGTQNFKEIEALSGCCMAYRRKALEHNRFDENLKDYSYMEDIDLSNRVSKEYGLFYEPACHIQHLKSPISRINHRKRSLMLVRNHHYLFKKNLPQTLIHRLIHTWSMFGLAVKMILDRSYDGFIGILMGWNDVLRSSE